MFFFSIDDFFITMYRSFSKIRLEPETDVSVVGPVKILSVRKAEQNKNPPEIQKELTPDETFIGKFVMKREPVKTVEETRATVYDQCDFKL